ncbi:ScbA/BarX family gamma-butyrolactone biosynthesis protein [Kitasatospora paracochleata]
MHRAAVAEVFVTDAVELSRDRYLVAAQWPRDHALYHPDPSGLADPLLFAETIRQGLVYLAHSRLGVPLGHRFVGTHMDFRITHPERLRVGAAPLAVVLDAELSRPGDRPPHRHGLRLDAVLLVDGVPCGRGGLSLFATDERRYRLLRGPIGRPAADGGPAPDPGGGPGGGPGTAGRAGSAGSPGSAGTGPASAEPGLPPGEVGRLRAKDSVLAPGEAPGEWRLGLDPGHAILFDHPTDHIPLMAALEGFRQLGHLMVHGPEATRPYALARVEVECHAFGELDLPTTLVLRDGAPGSSPGPARRMVVEACQEDRSFATATMDWAPLRTG